MSKRVPLLRDEPQRRALLSEILHAIRGVRGLRSREVAKAMGMKYRTYLHWAGGNEALDHNRVHAFAEAVDADGYAILLALELGSVDFAVYSLTNKVGTGLLVSLQRFNARIGRNLGRLDPHSIVTVLDAAFDELERRSRAFDGVFEDWMIDPAITEDPDNLPPPDDEPAEDDET